MTNRKTSTGKANNFQRIRELSRKQQSLLSLMLLERMKPNYQLFAQVTEFPQEHNLDNMMNSLWDKVLVKGAKVSFAAMENKIEEMTPDQNDFEMYGVFPAIYFCTALLTYISGEASELEFDPVAIAKISQGCIVHLLEYQAGEEELDNTSIREHELMVMEMAFLSEAMDYLTSGSTKLSANDIKQQAIQFALEDGVTNIGIALD